MVFATKYSYPVDRTPCFLTSRDGIIWSRWQRIATVGTGHYQVSASDGVKAGTMLNYHPETEGEVHGLNFRTNLYYLETPDMGRTWKTAGGEKLSLPLNDLAHWNGRKWEISEITTSDNNYDAGELILYPDRWILIAPTEKGPQPYNTGGELALWESRDRGKHWIKTGPITTGSEYNHTYVRRVLNAHPDFLALWADGHGRQPSNSRLYFINQHNEISRLPFSMSQDFEKSERIH
jgi:hypothetical protein